MKRDRQTGRNVVGQVDADGEFRKRGTSSFTGSLTITAPGHNVADVDAPNVTVRFEPALIAAPLSRRPTCTEPTTTAFVPKVFDSRRRSSDPPILTLAI